jgi:uncharacterized membrane protein YphA (DoxX/SURF4 family)
MQSTTISTVLQLVIGLGLINVWLLRAGSSTAYRGGEATSLQAEFAAYGLPVWFFYLIGFLKLGSAALLIAGYWIPQLVLPAAALVVALMVGALSMHARVKDPLIKWMPASIMLAMSSALVFLRLG